jgi:hypothetical protein
MPDREGHGEGPQFIAGMAESVSVLRQLSQTIADASARHGHLPAAYRGTAGMRDLEAEKGFADRFGTDWEVPVRDTHTLGAMTLLAASDYGHCYATLFDGSQTRAPVFGHVVLARAGLEACVVSSWLNEPTIDTTERVKRGLCEQLYSAREVKRLGLDSRAGERLQALNGVATVCGWKVRWENRKPVVDFTQRPPIGEWVSQMVLGRSDMDLGKVQWGYQSSVTHVTWYGLRQAITEEPKEPSLLAPSVAMVGTTGWAVNAQTFCLLRALRHAGMARMTLMGWGDDAEWTDASRRSEAHEAELLRALTSTTPRGSATTPGS